MCFGDCVEIRLGVVPLQLTLFHIDLQLFEQGANLVLFEHDLTFVRVEAGDRESGEVCVVGAAVAVLIESDGRGGLTLGGKVLSDFGVWCRRLHLFAIPTALHGSI